MFKKRRLRSRVVSCVRITFPSNVFVIFEFPVVKLVKAFVELVNLINEIIIVYVMNAQTTEIDVIIFRTFYMKIDYYVLTTDY